MVDPIRNRRGVTAVEFAVVGPIMILLAVVSVQAGLSMWKWNMMQSAAKAAARCVAIGSPLCAKQPPSCTSSDAGVCYALTTAAEDGLSSIPASAVTIDRNATIDGASFTVVRITSSATILTSPVTLTASASFPNS